MATIIPDLIKQYWHLRGYSFSVFREPPSQVWADFVHRTDELVVIAEGEIEVEIEGKAERFQIGGMVFIPAKEIWKII
jgi:mannose-6-phosphate isomerase-like protein (cupin superfamily)|tara:strand:- start:361 stop:594 length:234 start_codon:yes stop_codon:yes gene_type:complete